MKRPQGNLRAFCVGEMRRGETRGEARAGCLVLIRPLRQMTRFGSARFSLSTMH